MIDVQVESSDWWTWILLYPRQDNLSFTKQDFKVNEKSRYLMRPIIVSRPEPSQAIIYNIYLFSIYSECHRGKNKNRKKYLDCPQIQIILVNISDIN